jgi:hypothetical protein
MLNENRLLECGNGCRPQKQENAMTQKQQIENHWELSGKRLVVLGGSSGIGLAVAQQAVAQGATAIIASSNADRVKQAVATIDGKVEGHALDLSNERDIQKFFQKIGDFDHLVFTAGDTLQLNDGTLHTRFHPDCNRVENGVQTTHNPEFAKIVPVSALGCEEQFRMGNYRYDDRLRARRYPMVDEERGLVLAFAFIDHSGRLAEYKLTDGRTVRSPVRRPHSFYIAELFKIDHGMICQIEANFITVPYNMPRPWDHR